MREFVLLDYVSFVLGCLGKKLTLLFSPDIHDFVCNREKTKIIFSIWDDKNYLGNISLFDVSRFNGLLIGLSASEHWPLDVSDIIWYIYDIHLYYFWNLLLALPTSWVALGEVGKICKI